jgi:hypothetical protein
LGQPAAALVIPSVTSVSCDTPIKIARDTAAGAYGLGVGTTGVIFGAIAIAWLAYLVPHFVRHREDELIEEPELDNRFADSMRIVRTGAAPLLNQDLEQIKTFEVSTPQTRRAAVADLRRLERLAASRRRRVLLGLMAVLSATLGVCAVALIPWWAAAIPAGLLLIFVVVARISVRSMRKSLDGRYRSIRRGSDEHTVFLSRQEVSTATAGQAVNMQKPEAMTSGALWDPVPITMPTYVSKPLAPRTVRTIDLAGPEVASSSSAEVPVTADAPPASEVELVEPTGEELAETQQAATA